MVDCWIGFHQVSEQEFVAGYEQYSSSLEQAMEQAMEQVCCTVSFKQLVLLVKYSDNQGLPQQFYCTYGMLLVWRVFPP